MFDVVALGECLIDFTPSGMTGEGIPLYSQNPGGAPANVLAMLSRLGCHTAFIGKVGDDPFGSFLRCRLEDAGICCSGLSLDQRYLTSLAFVTLDASGDRSFLFYREQGADLMLEDSDIDKDLISGSRIFHFGSVSMTGEPSRTTTIDVAGYARKAGAVISFDPNYRAFLWKDPADAEKVISSVIPLCDIVKVSEEEMRLISGRDGLEDGSACIADKGPSIVIVTRGPSGAFVRAGGYIASFPAFDVRTIDTTGAGDAFYGAFLSRILASGYCSRGALASISEDCIYDALIYANAAGSLATASYGAIPAMPSADEIKDCIENIGLLGGHDDYLR